jgi:hypothetical protein
MHRLQEEYLFLRLFLIQDILQHKFPYSEEMGMGDACL